jgi:septal ring factor EnvC (AmiA/AmiB activator)
MNRAKRGLITAMCCSLAAVPVVRAQSFGAGAVAEVAEAGSAATELAAAVRELERLSEQGQRLEAEAQGLEPRREALRERARREIRLLYHLAQGEALALRGGPEALLDHVARVQYVRRALRSTLSDLETAVQRAATIQDDRAQHARALTTARERRETLEQQRRQAELLAGLRIPVTNAGLTEETTAPSVTVYGGGIAAAVSDAPSFADAAGRLLFPVAGRAEVRRTQRPGTDGPGLEIVAPLGSPVRASFAARVAFADRYGPYGRIVILDHGAQYYTVSANLASIQVRVGEEVSAGSVLGTVGDDGRGPMLYFEVRRGSETIDPAPWLGL